MKRFINRRKAARGNVMLATIGTLAVLAIVVMAAANSTQMTWNTASIAVQDTRLRSALAEAAVLVQQQPLKFASAETTGTQTADGTTTAPVGNTIIPAKPGSNEVEVRATPESLDSIPAEIARRPGDIAFLLHARIASGKGQQRASIYVFNPQSERASPILVSERRL